MINKATQLYKPSYIQIVNGSNILLDFLIHLRVLPEQSIVRSQPAAQWHVPFVQVP